MSTRSLNSRPPRAAPHSAGAELPHPELLDGIDEALRSSDPLALLMLASGIITILDPRHQSPLQVDTGRLTLVELCETFMEAGFRQTDALLKVIGELAGDDLLRGRIRRSVSERRHAIPGWVVRLHETRPYRAVEMTHVLRDGDNVVIGVALSGKRELSLVIYIDHNLGTLVKDAFVLGAPIDEVMVSWNAVDPESGAETTDLALRDARARVTESIATAAMTFPPFETDTWPACRPLVEWIVSMLPDDGVGYVRPEWSPRQLTALTESFFASKFGSPLDDEDNRSLLESILWFATDYGPGDPLRWSPVSVEILLEDWIPRKIVAPADYLSKAPTLLRAFIRYCHAERKISQDLTDQTIEAVDIWEPDYQLSIGSPRHQGALALLERLGALPGMNVEWDGDDPNGTNGLSHSEYMLDSLARSVGGIDVLDTLAADPLPDEPFEWTGMPDDIVGRVAEVADSVDGCCDELFDLEFRTASRRLLSQVAGADPGIFRRKSSAVTTAAAICWIIAKANDAFDLYGSSGSGSPRVKDFMAHFGLSGSVSQRAEPMLRAIGRDWRYGRTTLGDPRLLVSRTRLRLCEARDLYRNGG